MKKQLREKTIKLRNELENKDILSKKITEAFLMLPEYKNCESVLLYCSTGSEVSTGLIFEACLCHGKTVAFPVCIDKEGTMDFFTVKSKVDLEEGMYGIMCPKSHCEKLIPDEKSLCVVPGLVFDRYGHRLGYGKGYYDRYLSSFKGTSCGLCYEALVVEKLPFDSFDKKVNCLITDKNTYIFNSKEDLKNG